MKAFQSERIKEENELRKKYGLKNKTEIWKTKAKVDYYRGRGKALAQAPLEEQEVLFRKLRAIGLNVNNISEVLGLQIENVLDRRLSTIVAKKKLANTVRQGRQMITHKKILVDGKVVSAPSYLVPVTLEGKISVKVKQKKPKAKPAAEENTESEEGEAVEDGTEDVEEETENA